VATIALDGRPAFAASDDKGHLFVNLIDKGVVLRIDSRTLTAKERWPVSACGGPYNETMAIDKKNERLFVGCRPDYRQMLAPPGPRPNRVMAILDANDGRVITTVPIGGNPDQADFDPGTGLVFSANGEGTVTVIKEDSPDRFSILETVTTEPGAARLAVDPKTHKLFVPNADLDAAPSPTEDSPPSRTRNFRVLILGM
jgi:DNA-binding beta-propeller fold protein YncE